MSKIEGGVKTLLNINKVLSSVEISNLEDPSEKDE